MTMDRWDVGTNTSETAGGVTGGERWREVLRQLVDNARTRQRYEAIETELLVEAEACDLARKAGYVSLEDFVEKALGYTRHAANERVRVARELQALPRLRAAFEAGDLSFTHLRELTRVATPATEGAYLAAAAGKTSREVQQLVSGKKAGDAPEAPPDPALVKHTVVLELGGEAFAMWRRAQQQLEAEVGQRMSADEFVVQLCTYAFALPPAAGVSDETDGTRSRGTEVTGLDARTAEDDTGEAGSVPSRGTAATGAPSSVRARRSRGTGLGAPHTLLAVTTCRHCARASASSVGGAEPLTAAQRDRARCDGLFIGDLDSNDRTRPTLTIPAAIRRKVAIACNHACVVPGCRSRRFLDVHHLRPQEHGGTHTVENCAALCRFHHQKLHAGLLRIEGTAPHGLTFAWRHPSTDAEQDAGAGPCVWRAAPPGALHRRRAT